MDATSDSLTQSNQRHDVLRESLKADLTILLKQLDRLQDRTEMTNGKESG
jgi:hypothetical protein